MFSFVFCHQPNIFSDRRSVCREGYQASLGSACCSDSIVFGGDMDFFDAGETAFILYALVYFALGIAAMLIFMLRKK